MSSKYLKSRNCSVKPSQSSTWMTPFREQASYNSSLQKESKSRRATQPLSHHDYKLESEEK